MYSRANSQSFKGKILVIDDERIVRDSAAIVLRKLGYDVETASSGEEALEMCRSHQAGKEKFDVVSVDLNLPGRLSGKNMIEALIVADPEIRVIVSSGDINDEMMTTCREFGAMAFLPKPWTVPALKDVLDEILTAVG